MLGGFILWGAIIENIESWLGGKKVCPCFHDTITSLLTLPLINTDQTLEFYISYLTFIIPTCSIFIPPI